MKSRHFSEKDIELFILNKNPYMEFENEFQEHINVCSGCRELYNEISQFYEALRDNQSNQIPDKGKLPAGSIPIKIKSEYVEYKPPVENVAVVYGNFTYLAKRYVRNHPVLSGAYLIAAAAVILFFYNYKTIFRDTDPAYYLIDDSRDVLEVFNAKNEMLWQKKYFGDKEIRALENQTEMKRVILADIDNDGKNEVITILRGLEKEEPSAVLRVLNGKGNIILEKQLGREIKYDDNKYDNIYLPRALAVDNFGNDKNKQILVGLYNRYAPSYIVRLDKKGDILGEYWHYGRINSMNEAIIKNKKMIVIAGIDEVSKKADAAVIDPEKLTGIQASGEHTGFGYPASDAETFKVEFPHSDMDKVITNSKPRARLIVPMNDKTIGFTAGHDLEGLPVFEYYFDRNTLNLTEIKINDKAKYAHDKLKREGKIKSTLDEKYLLNLKNGIEYLP